MPTYILFEPAHEPPINLINLNPQLLELANGLQRHLNAFLIPPQFDVPHLLPPKVADHRIESLHIVPVVVDGINFLLCGLVQLLFVAVLHGD